MSKTAKHFYKTNCSEMEVKIYFQNELKREYALYTQGGRVQFNATRFTIKPTLYESRF